MAMRRAAWVLAIVTTVAFVSAAAAQTPYVRHHHRHTHYVHGGGVGLAYAPAVRGVPHGHGTHYVTLVGDPGGGLGFYALPTHYRVAALRYRLRNRPGPWDDPVRYAVMADAVRYPGWSSPNADYRYGVFNPYDGVGTPFFAGWYGPAGDSDDDSGFPFGHPYK
jgi:hypothetical protein